MARRKPHRDPDGGGDSPGLNAAIRGIGSTRARSPRMTLVGLPRRVPGARRGSVHRAGIQKAVRDPHDRRHDPGDEPGQASPDARRRSDRGHMNRRGPSANYEKHGLDALVCLGGGGTAKNALAPGQGRSQTSITLPKTIDNDVVRTDACFGLRDGRSTWRPTRSTGLPPARPTAITASSSSRSWATGRAGSPSGPESPVGADVIHDPEIRTRGGSGRPGRPAAGVRNAVELQHRGDRRGRPGTSKTPPP